VQRTFATPGLIALLVLLAAPLHAGPLAPTRASQVVTLTRTSTACGVPGSYELQQILPDGSDAPFAIPANRVLVVTGYQVSQNGAGGALAGETVGFGLLAGSTNLTFETVVADANNAYSALRSLSPGIVVASGTPLCVVAQVVSNAFAGQSVGFSARVYGFIAKDK
jgi:hypothetical protein